MSLRSKLISDQVLDYVVAHSSAPDAVLVDLARETAALGDIARMQIAPEQGAFLTLLTGLAGARDAVEVGTFTGYSAICIARALQPGGRLLCCDISTEWTALARDYFDRAGVSDRIELRIAPAVETLTALPPEPSLDLAFIDADKTGYRTYWELLIPRMRPGGVVLVDNTLWSGKVVDPAATDADTLALREFNDHVVADPRVEVVLLPFSDGLTVARRRG